MSWGRQQRHSGRAQSGDNHEVALITEWPINSHETDIQTRAPFLVGQRLQSVTGESKGLLELVFPGRTESQSTRAGICMTRD